LNKTTYSYQHAISYGIDLSFLQVLTINPSLVVATKQQVMATTLIIARS